MKLSLHSEYALLSLIHLARHGDGETTVLEAIAASQQIPAEPLAEILSALTIAKYVRKADGTYRLTKPADKITVAEVIRLFDGALAPLEPVSEKGYQPAPMEKEQKLTDLFGQIQDEMLRRLENATVAELA
jgi:Rrf2 family transcriptional regulator, cysteine metabolism repressor